MPALHPCLDLLLPALHPCLELLLPAQHPCLELLLVLPSCAPLLGSETQICSAVRPLAPLLWLGMLPISLPAP